MSETLSEMPALPAPPAPPATPATSTFAGSLVRKRLQILALGAMSGIYFLSYFQRVAVPGAIFNQIQTDLNVPARSVTALAAILLYSYAAVQLFVGLCADRFGGVRVMMTGGLVMAAGAIMFPLCHSLTALYLCRALTGFGAGFVFLSTLREIAVMFGRRHFVALIAMLTGVGYLGGITATLPLERITMLVGDWRMALEGFGVLTLVCVLLAGLLLKRLGLPRERGASLSLRPIFEILANRRCWPLLVINVINFPIYFVIQTTIGKKFLEDFGGLSSAMSASMTMLMLACCGSATLFGGFLPRWCGHRRRPVMILGTVLVMMSLAILLVGIHFGAPGWILLAGYVVLASSTCSGPMTTTLMKELNRPEVVAVAIAIPNSLCYGGVAVLANGAGLVLDCFASQAIVKPDHLVYPPAAYALLFLILLALSVISLIASCMVRDGEIIEPKISQISEPA